MSPITKYFRAVLQAARKFDKAIQIECTGGVEVVRHQEVDSLFVPIKLWLPFYKAHTTTNPKLEPACTYPKTSDPFPIADAVREALDEAGMVGSDSVVVRMKDSPPPKVTKKTTLGIYGTPLPSWTKSRNYWEIDFLLPCPPPLITDNPRVLELCLLYKKEYARNLGDETILENAKFTFGEEIITGAERYDSSWYEDRASVQFYRTRTAWYVCSVKKSNGAVAHAIVRDKTHRRARSDYNRRRTTPDGYMFGRTLYCLKSCLVKNPDQWW